LRGLILWPALVTLAVTLLRLVGELLQWSPRFFSREAGGGAALVGIVWLVPVFGAYFALRLCREGEAPPSAGRAAGLAFLALVVNIALAAGAFSVVKSPVGQLAIFTMTSWLTLLIARPAWPALWRVLLAYALCARLPVLVVMAVSIFGGLDTHYAKPRPDFPPMGPMGIFFWTALLPQLSFWIWFTVVFGIIAGAIVARLVRRPVASAAARPAA
jgi:hypothetical protein